MRKTTISILQAEISNSFFFRTRRFIFLVNMYTSLDNNSILIFLLLYHDFIS